MGEPGGAEPLPARRRALALASTALAVAALAGYLWTQRETLAERFAFDPLAMAGIVALTIATLALRALANRALFGRLGVDAPPLDWLAIVSVQSLSNYLPLSAGLVAKGYYFKRVHGMAVGAFGVAQSALLLLFVATNGAVGFAATALVSGGGARWLALGFAAMAAAGSLVLLPPRVGAGIARRTARWIPWNEATADAVRRCAAAVAPAQIGVLLCTALCLQLGFSMNGVEIGLGPCAIFAAATVITRIVSVAPGALGFRELLIGGLAVATGFELEDAVVAATAARAGEMVAVFALGGAFAYRFGDRVASR